jgi:predicted Zn-dependent protease
MNKGDLAVEHNDMKTALKEYGAAQKLFPENLEMKYWTAVALANNKDLEKAIPIFKEVFEKDKNWKELTKRLPKSGLLTVSKEQLNNILSQ